MPFCGDLNIQNNLYRKELYKLQATVSSQAYLASLDTRACNMEGTIPGQEKETLEVWSRLHSARPSILCNVSSRFLLLNVVSLWVCVGDMDLEYCCAGSFATKNDHLGKACLWPICLHCGSCKCTKRYITSH